MLAKKSSVHFVNSSITDNERVGGRNWAVLTVQGAGLWLEGTEVRRNNAAVLMRTRNNATGVIVTDTPSEYFIEVSNAGGKKSLTRTTAPLQPPPQFEFMTGAEQWFLSMVQVRICSLLLLCVVLMQWSILWHILSPGGCMHTINCTSLSLLVVVCLWPLGAVQDWPADADTGHHFVHEAASNAHHVITPLRGSLIPFLAL